MTVKELIQHLQQFDPDLPVCYSKYSECCTLDASDITLAELQPARADGWIHSDRPDKDKVTYVVFPGN